MHWPAALSITLLTLFFDVAPSTAPWGSSGMPRSAFDSTHDTRTVTVVASGDATLIEDPAGGLANGTGPLFVGRTSQSEGSRRRSIVRFDLRGVLPRRAIVESATLSVHVQPSNLGSPIRLHRVLTDWSEGITFSGGGGGRTAATGDATWIHTEYPDDRWVRAGGHFVWRASASAKVTAPGELSWNTTRPMLADVRLWQHAPDRNFGWILIGDESESQTSTSLASREDPSVDRRPRLTIRFRTPSSR